MKPLARALVVGPILVALFGLAACSGSNAPDTSGGGEEGNRTVETGSAKTFCQATAELASSLATDRWTPGVPVEQGFAKTFEALDAVANSAPAEAKGDAEALRSALEKFYSSLDDVQPVGTPPDPARQQQAQAGLQKTQEAFNGAAPVRERVALHVQTVCPGTTLPAITVPAPPSS